MEYFLICKICNKTFKNKKSLGAHIGYCHNTKKYYDTFIKKSNDEIQCKICGNETEFINLQKGYKQTCSKECCDKLNSTILKNLNQDEILKKRKDTCLTLYGVENVFQSEKIKKKCKQTHIKKLGVENPSQSNIIKLKKEETCLRNHGVRYYIQDEQRYIQTFKTRILLKQFKNTNINYRGTYELDFLEKYYDIFPDIQNGPTIKYIFQGKERCYFPDFYIPSINLIVEIKNSYLAKKDKEKIVAKEKAVINNGFKYIMIIDKNYKLFF